MTDYAGLILFVLFLAAILAVNVGMFISLGRQGDERRRLIVQKAGFNTFVVVVIYVLFCVVENMVNVLARGSAAENMNPFILLTVMATIYAAQLFYFKRRYGD